MNSISVKKRLFGGEVEFMLFDTDKTFANPILADTYEEALRLQKIFNFYDKDSELSKLNRLRTIKPSKELLHVITTALTLCKATNGKYDISKGKEILAQKQGIVSKSNCTYQDIEIKNNMITLKKDAMIDLGSIAKGYIADKLSIYLEKQGVTNNSIDARGDIITKGTHEYIVEIQHPRNKSSVGKVKIKNQGVATSGDYNQKDHILNQNAISVTVIAKDLETADAYATALFVTNEKERAELMKNKAIQALIIDKNLKQTTYNGFTL